MEEYMASNVKSLIDNANKLIKKRNQRLQEKLLTFNIFDICDIACDEVRVCRFLSELLNPKGRHMQGIKYLKLFFKMVLKYETLPSDDELFNAIVLKEETIKNDRRIDISIALHINNKKYYIPIEVKINARDQEDQCHDYYEHSVVMNHDDKAIAFIYYLTPDGKYPSLYSIEELNPTVIDDIVIECRQVKCLSFRDDIQNWINACISESYDDKLISERQVLWQFKKIIDDIGGNSMGDQALELVNNISNSKDNFEAAKLISDNFQKAANQKLERFYNLIYSYLESEGWMREKNIDEDLQDFGIKKSKWPTMYKDFAINNVICELAITTEGNGIPFLGVSLKRGEDASKENVLKDYFEDKKLENDYSYGWITWQYLPSDNEAPNFKYFNDVFYMLFDDNQTKILVEKCVNIIKEFECKIVNGYNVLI